MVLSVSSRRTSYLIIKKQAQDETFHTLNATIRAPSSVKRRYQRRRPFEKTVNMTNVLGQSAVALCGACSLSLSGRTRCLCLAWVCLTERKRDRERGAWLLMCGANRGSIVAHPSLHYLNPEEILKLFPSP